MCPTINTLSGIGSSLILAIIVKRTGCPSESCVSIIFKLSRYVWPNITGSLGEGKDQQSANQLMEAFKYTGALFFETKWMNWAMENSGGYQLPSKIYFDASRSAAIYDGSKNQPQALLACPCIHT